MQAQQLEAVEVRIEDVLRDLKAIAHTDLQALSQSQRALGPTWHPPPAGPPAGGPRSQRAVHPADLPLRCHEVNECTSGPCGMHRQPEWHSVLANGATTGGTLPLEPQTI